MLGKIDAEAGTISQRDIEELDKQIGDKDNYPFVIVFNKMDKKPNDEIVKILKSAEKVCKSKLKIQPIDIIGFSSIGESAIFVEDKEKSNYKRWSDESPCFYSLQNEGWFL